VQLTFTSAGSDIWGKYTSANVGKQAAFVLDSRVVSAPRINGPITGGVTSITGKFSQPQAQDLANTLKYGSLPLSFDQSTAQTVSASLGLASLQAGLLAGGIGLILVLIYCLAYYRMLGILTALSLLLSGVVIYAVLVLLGRYIGFTLDLSGIAGFIVAIGITADSFVVFFERLKDEVREGRSFRSAVPRGWVRARRTILTADAVSFLAAAVLYTLAVGQVGSRNVPSERARACTTPRSIPTAGPWWLPGSATACPSSTRIEMCQPSWSRVIVADRISPATGRGIRNFTAPSLGSLSRTRRPDSCSTTIALPAGNRSDGAERRWDRKWVRHGLCRRIA